MKKDQYFNLEVNLLNDDNIAGMMLELGAANALGVYVMLLLHLRTKDNYEASCRPLPLKALAKRYDVDVDLIGPKKRRRVPLDGWKIPYPWIREAR